MQRQRCTEKLAPIDAPTGFAAVASVMEIEGLFMELLAQATADERPLSASNKATNCAALGVLRKP